MNVKQRIIEVLSKRPMKAGTLNWEMRDIVNDIYYTCLEELIEEGIIEKYWPYYFINSRMTRSRKLTYRLRK